MIIYSGSEFIKTRRGNYERERKGETFVRDFFVDKPINDFVLDDNTRSSEGGS